MKEYETEKFTSDTVPLKLSGAEFLECEFTGISFIDTSFKSTRFLECEFKECSFTSIDLLYSTFRDVTFENSRATGLNWSLVSSLKGLAFKDCKLDLSVFQNLNLTASYFEACSIKEVDFSNSKMKKVIFKDCDLYQSVFSGCDLELADLRYARNYIIDPAYTKLMGMKVSFPAATSILEAIGLEVE